MIVFKIISALIITLLLFVIYSKINSKSTYKTNIVVTAILFIIVWFLMDSFIKEKAFRKNNNISFTTKELIQLLDTEPSKRWDYLQDEMGLEGFKSEKFENSFEYSPKMYLSKIEDETSTIRKEYIKFYDYMFICDNFNSFVFIVLRDKQRYEKFISDLTDKKEITCTGKIFNKFYQLSDSCFVCPRGEQGKDDKNYTGYMLIVSKQNFLDVTEKDIWDL